MNWDLIMNENFATALGFIGLGSCAAVGAWAVERRKEREAFYRNDAIKKVAEMKGETPEPVLQLLRDALAEKPKAPSGWTTSPRVQRAYYRNVTLQRIADTQGSEALVAFLREEQRRADRRQREGIKLGGLITAGVGLALFVFLRGIEPDEPVYLVGLIPGMVGAALLIYGYFMAPQE